ncbi:hypothetical protein [Flavivirga spongiicola]|uniref:DUF4105 domain-containing protein n=1 Tax=Flavivirga spongiicola TaxID=421621 RepID=A0ABU7XM45_9FLAO|nr:hypothetical protein [Flavivirga sp. MEBiC05379]MDO5981475.1 hypothetical protein [Flavivirga sp. MEBiC05379]
MKTIISNIIIPICIVFSSYATHADVYYIFYATINGKSGHAGIAIDNYKTVVKDTLDENNNVVSVYNIIKDGTLTYYDLWPEKDDFNAFNVDDDTVAKYYKLPAASWENPITITSLLSKGIPHEEHYPVDGLIQLKSAPEADAILKEVIEDIIENNQSFNVRTFNCADFIEIILEKHLDIEIHADESVFFKQSTTPNRLYQELSKLKDINIIKNADEKARGTFTSQRLIKKT